MLYASRHWVKEFERSTNDITEGVQQFLSETTKCKPQRRFGFIRLNKITVQSSEILKLTIYLEIIGSL